MRQATPLITLAMAVLLLTACGSPMRDYADTQTLWIGTMEAAIAAREAGVIDADEWTNYYLPAMREANKYLDDMGDRARVGDRNKVSDYAALIGRIAIRVAANIEAAKQEDE